MKKLLCSLFLLCSFSALAQTNFLWSSYYTSNYIRTNIMLKLDMLKQTVFTTNSGDVVSNIIIAIAGTATNGGGITLEDATNVSITVTFNATNSLATIAFTGAGTNLDGTYVGSGLTFSGPGLLGSETNGTTKANTITVGSGLAISNSVLILAGVGSEATNVLQVISGDGGVVVFTNGLDRILYVGTNILYSFLQKSSGVLSNVVNGISNLYVGRFDGNLLNGTNVNLTNSINTLPDARLSTSVIRTNVTGQFEQLPALGAGTLTTSDKLLVERASDDTLGYSQISGLGSFFAPRYGPFIGDGVGVTNLPPASFTNMSGVIYSNDYGRMRVASMRPRIHRVPPMGMDTWYLTGPFHNETTIKTYIDIAYTNGLVDLGWKYISITDGWQGVTNASGVLMPDAVKYPNITNLVQYAHDRGMKIRLYTEATPLTSVGSNGTPRAIWIPNIHAWDSWGIDDIQFDVIGVAGGGSSYDMDLKAHILRDFVTMIRTTSVRPISVYSGGWRSHTFLPGVSNYNALEIAYISDTWRNVGDLGQDSPPGYNNMWTNYVYAYLPAINEALYTQTMGSWNQIDHLVLIGDGEAETNTTRGTFTMAATFASPMFVAPFAGPNESMFRYSILTNRAMLHVAQDGANFPAYQMLSNSTHEIYVRRLRDDSYAVAFLNHQTNVTTSALLTSAMLGFPSNSPLTYVSVWYGTNGYWTNTISHVIPKMCADLFIVRRADPSPEAGVDWLTLRHVPSLGSGSGLPGTNTFIAYGDQYNTNSLNIGTSGTTNVGPLKSTSFIGNGYGLNNIPPTALTNVTGSQSAVLSEAPTIHNANFTGVATWESGQRQIFNPSATKSGFNPGGYPGDPSSLVDGDVWYNSFINQLRGRIGGATVSFGTGSGNVTSSSGSDNHIAIYDGNSTSIASSVIGITDSGDITNVHILKLSNGIYDSNGINRLSINTGIDTQLRDYVEGVIVGSSVGNGSNWMQSPSGASGMAFRDNATIVTWGTWDNFNINNLFVGNQTVTNLYTLITNSTVLATDADGKIIAGSPGGVVSLWWTNSAAANSISNNYTVKAGSLMLGTSEINSWDDVTNYFAQTGTGGPGTNLSNLTVTNSLIATNVQTAGLTNNGTARVNGDLTVTGAINAATFNATNFTANDAILTNVYTLITNTQLLKTDANSKLVSGSGYLLPVSWTNMVNIPAGFADGTDDGGVGGGTTNVVNNGTHVLVTSPLGTTRIDIQNSSGGGNTNFFIKWDNGGNAIQLNEESGNYDMTLSSRDGNQLMTLNNAGLTLPATATAGYFLGAASWTNLVNVPAGFADGTDDGGGGGASTNLPNLTVTNSVIATNVQTAGLTNNGAFRVNGDVTITGELNTSTFNATNFTAQFAWLTNLFGVVSSTNFTGNGLNLTNIPIASIVSPGAILTNGATINTDNVVLKKKEYLCLKGFDVAVGALPVNTNDFTAITYMSPEFLNGTDKAANYIEWRICVPEDIDTAVALRARVKFRLTAADTGSHRYVLSFASVADSAAATGTVGTEINLDFAGDASGASGDIETTAWTTLTGWAAGMTAGQLWVIRLARDGDTTDTSTVNSQFNCMMLEYSSTQ